MKNHSPHAEGRHSPLARLSAALDRSYRSLRQLLRVVIPIKHRRRVIRLSRHYLGTLWGTPAASKEASIRALQSLLERSAPQTFDVICFPIIDWDFRFQRPQQLMTQFAAAGHRVFYICQSFRSHGDPYELTQKGPNIYEVSLRGRDRNVYAESLTPAEVTTLLTSIDSMRRALSLGATAMIAQLPFWRPLVRVAHERFGWPVIYDCMDYHAGFSTNRPEMLEEEKDLIATADCVLVSSRFLEKQTGPGARHTLLLRNGCDFDHFARVRPRLPSDRAERPVIGYYGAIAEWFDSDLVADLAARHPEWDFVLVGSTFSANINRFAKLHNVSMTGERPYHEIPDIVGKFDVLMLPFVRTPLTEATNPVKAYEILAAGKPLVSVPIAEMVELVPFVRLASDVTEFEAQITEALAESNTADIERRRSFARENTWRKRFEVLDPVLRASFPLASVIIVTYNNLSLNELCLRSLFHETDWPNLEVIVVDNGSTDGTRDLLQAMASQHPNLRTILNEANRGFAAANNQGLREAIGQYLVLLNNDTAVTRGWLSTLIRHLSNDKEIGLIGPVTNEIGNEAKVAAGYRSLSEMPAWAAEYVRQHDGDLFEIPMLAMFCVAMRRDVFKRVGFLDERFGIGMFEDDDYARRVIAAGYQIRCARDSFVHHAGSASFKKLASDDYFQLFERNRQLYEEKWGELWQPHEDEAAKALLPDLRSQLRRIVSGRAQDFRAIFILLPGEVHREGERRHLAHALAEQKCLVIVDCSGNQGDQFFGFKQQSQFVYFYRGPRGALEELERPVLWALAQHAKLTEKWPHATIIYDCDPETKRRFPEGHLKLLTSAAVVVAESGQSLELEAIRPDVLLCSRHDSVSLANLAAEVLDRLTPRIPHAKDARG